MAAGIELAGWGHHPEDLSEGHHLTPFAPGPEGGSWGAGQYMAGGCMPQQKVRLRNQRFWQAHDPGEIYRCIRGLGSSIPERCLF